MRKIKYNRISPQEINFCGLFFAAFGGIFFGGLGGKAAKGFFKAHTVGWRLGAGAGTSGNINSSAHQSALTPSRSHSFRRFCSIL